MCQKTGVSGVETILTQMENVNVQFVEMITNISIF